MKDVFTDYTFNTTLQLLLACFTVCFVVINLKSCEVEKMKKAQSIEELKNTGLR